MFRSRKSRSRCSDRSDMSKRSNGMRTPCRCCCGLKEQNRLAPARQQYVRWVEQQIATCKAWPIVRRSDSSTDAYAGALRRIQAAVQMKPDSGGLLNTLGLAQYRVGDYQAALKTLTRSVQLNRKQFGSELPYDIVFLAMTHQQLGDTDKARERLVQLRKVIQQPKWVGDSDLQSFVKEAETLIDSRSKPDTGSSQVTPPKQPGPPPPPLPEKKTAA